MPADTRTKKTQLVEQITRESSLVVCLLLWRGVSGVGVFLLLRLWFVFVGFP